MPSTPEVTSGAFADLPADEPHAGITRRTFSSEQATVTQYTFRPGATFPLHDHPQEQITLVQSGEVEMTVGDTVERLAAGAWSVVAGDVVHGITAGPDGAQILAIIVPARASADAYRIAAGSGAGA